MVAVQPNLVELGQGVFAFVDPTTKFGHSNVGLVIDADGLTIIDTTATPQQAAVTADAIHRLTSSLELPIKRVIATSSRVAFSGGGGRFWSAAFYGTEATSDQLDEPSNPEAFQRLLPDFAQSYSEEFATRPITHTVTEPASITPAAYAIPLAGESASNLAVFVESANVVFTGALASFGVTPLGFNAYFTNWIESLQQIAELGATVVPGHGMVGGKVDLDNLIGYLRACVETKPGTAFPKGPWDDWSDRRFDPVNVERAQLLSQGIDEVPQSMYSLLGFDT